MASTRDFFLVGGGRLATALLALVALRVVTTLLSPAQYGELALIVAVQMFFGLFIISPVLQYINRHTHEWWEDSVLLSQLASFRRFVLAVSVVGALTLIGVIGKKSSPETILAALAMLGMIYGSACNATYITTLNLLGFRRESVVWSITTATIGLVMAVWLVSLFPVATAWFTGLALGMGVGAIGAWRVLLRHALPTNFPNQVHPLLSRSVVLTYCLPLAIATGFMWLQVSGYRFVIKAYWGLEMLGYIAVGLLLANQISALAESLAQQFLYPLFYRRIIRADAIISKTALSDLLNVLGPLYLVLTGMIIVGAPHILKLLASPQFGNAEFFVRLGAVIECCRVLGNVVGNAAQVTKQTHSMAFPYALGAIVLFVLMVWAGINHARIMWIGLGLVVAAVVTLVAMWVFMYRQVQFNLDFRRWLLGILVMLALALPALWIEPPSGVFQAIYELAAIVVVGGAAMVGLLWRNLALGRLIDVNLRRAR